jgi:hypothetical protein
VLSAPYSLPLPTFSSFLILFFSHVVAPVLLQSNSSISCSFATKYFLCATPRPSPNLSNNINYIFAGKIEMMIIGVFKMNFPIEVIIMRDMEMTVTKEFIHYEINVC